MKDFRVLHLPFKFPQLFGAACAVLWSLGASAQDAPPLSQVVTGSAEEVFGEFMTRCVARIDAGQMPLTMGLVPQDIITTPNGPRPVGSDHLLPSGAYMRLASSNGLNTCAVWTPTAQSPDLIGWLDLEFNAWAQTLLAEGGDRSEVSRLNIDMTVIDMGPTATRPPVRVMRSASAGSRGFMIIGDFELPPGALR